MPSEMRNIKIIGHIILVVKWKITRLSYVV